MADNIAGLQVQPQPQFLPRAGVQEGPQLNRGACASVGFLAGWLPVNCCSLGLVPAILSGLGIGTAYFATGKTILFGLGWTPIWAAVSVIFILGVSRLVARPAFATHSREIAVRNYWRTAGYMGLAAGITFIVWTELVMPLLFVLGVPMGALFHH